ncbi:hypothetical protein [Lederbergia citrea]|uniref:Uncharacterized protein n=1 Tax=Lederbergia citrea TaxID=2833581 RepID=A0A942UTJ2_9BACI|nr:hypothetical protein [Lederbergia citrea]MBS4179597.1 hypothetical protein [Lederbergia citrea]MBS4206264.1 hypothetical protein [Lederbergia citrea]MBS4224801.1 hypothetical protein [Lederbergia citrea]
MDILIPIGIGFGANTLIYFVALGLLKNKHRAVKSTLIAPIMILISAYIMGRWIGMGLAVISFGMLAAAMIILFINFLIESSRNKRVTE